MPCVCVIHMSSTCLSKCTPVQQQQYKAILLKSLSRTWSAARARPAPPAGTRSTQGLPSLLGFSSRSLIPINLPCQCTQQLAGVGRLALGEFLLRMSDPPPHPEIVFGQSLETAGSIGRALEDAADTEPLQSWPERFSGVGLDVGSEASDGGEPSALGGSGGGWADVTPSPFPTFGTSVSSLRSLEQPLRQGSELAAAIQAATAAVAAQRGSSASCSAAAAEADERDSPLERLRHHAKHVFVFSTAGKPVYSYHGGEEELAGVMAAAQAIMAVVQGRGQGLRYVR